MARAAGAGHPCEGGTPALRLHTPNAVPALANTVRGLIDYCLNSSVPAHREREKREPTWLAKTFEN